MDVSTREHWIAATAILLGSGLVGYGVRTVLVGRLATWFARTPSDVDDLVLESTKRHLPFWFLLGGLCLAANVSPIPQYLAAIVMRVAAVLLVLSLSFAAARFSTGLLSRRAARSTGGMAVTSLSLNIVRCSILVVGALLALSNLGISITPLLTALGVGSLAVALALQPTLANLFAGIHITVARPIRVGDFIALESGAKGYVQDIGWRATRIRELPNNLIILPNSRLAEMMVTNYSMPEPEQAALVQVGVSYGSDMQKVERVTCEAAREVLQSVPGGVSQFEPFIRYHTFGESSIDFTVVLRVRDFADRYLVTHEFMKRLKARYDIEGIEIPFPQRVIHHAEPSPASTPSTDRMSLPRRTG